MSSSQLFLCLDCGGSKTAAAISDIDGVIVGRGTGGPSNYTSVGLSVFLQAIKTATIDALRSLPTAKSNDVIDLPRSEGTSYFEAVWLGVSGVDRSQDITDLSPHVAQLFSIPQGSPRLIIANDTHLLASPLRFHPEAETAVVIIAGTGSIVVSFKASDAREGALQELGRAGGYGWILGDEGGGYHVGLQTLKWVLGRNDKRSVDGVSMTEGKDLQEKIFNHFGISSAPDIFSVVYAPDPDGAPSNAATPTSPAYLALEKKHRIASLAPLVFSAAFDGENPDQDALSILHSTTQALTDQIRLVLSGSGERAIDSKKTVLCFGGSLVGVGSYRDLIIESLRRGGYEFAAAEFVKNVHESGAQGLASMFKTQAEIGKSNHDGH